MKKIMTTLACVAALTVPVVAAPTASAGSGCHWYPHGNNYTISGYCESNYGGQQFQLVVDCPDGRRWSQAKYQGNWVTMQCHNIRFVRLGFI